MLTNLIKEIQSLANPKRAKIMQGFFKTGSGEYGQGDIFLGLTVPQQRQIAKKYTSLPLVKIQTLLKNKIHEYRLIGLLILGDKFKKSKSEEEKGDIFNFYIKNIKYVNNWDLVDLTAPNIVGEFLFDKKKNILYKLSESENLWEKRISIIATFNFIRKAEFKDALRISEILLKDNHDLIHKAVGWMLREIGKKDQVTLEEFLKTHYKNMPKTMLRYSIEKFPEDLRKKYLKGEI